MAYFPQADGGGVGRAYEIQILGGRRRLVIRFIHDFNESEKTKPLMHVSDHTVRIYNLVCVEPCRCNLSRKHEAYTERGILLAFISMRPFPYFFPY
jgi:hypothetical protein